MSKSIRVGLIGYGMAGQVFHAPIINSIQGLILARIRETKTPNISIAQARYPQAQIVQTSEDILTDPTIDLVVIATPNTSHFSIAKEALLNNKHVVVDKPFTITSTEANELIELAKNQDKLLSVFQNRRWDSDFKTVKKLLEENTLGQIVEVEIHFDRFRPVPKENAWREEKIPGSGLLYDLGSHLIDQSLVLFGDPEAITADVRIQREQASVDDYFQVELHYGSLKVILKAGVLVKELGPHYIIHGYKGSFIKYGLDVQETALKQGLIPSETPEWGVEPEKLWGKLNQDINGESQIRRIKSEIGDYRGYYQNVYESILGQANLAVTPEQAAKVIYLIEMALKSTQERRTLDVSLPLN